MSIVVVRSARPSLRASVPRASWPRVFLSTAAFIAVVSALCAVAGLRADVAVVCGMTPASNLHALLGVLYVGSHLALVAIAPILTLAACFGIAVYRRI